MKAADLKRMAEEAERLEANATLQSVCQMVEIGVGTLQSRERTADTAKRRAVVAWILSERLKWPPVLVAKAIKRTVRQVRTLVSQEKG